MAARAPNCVPAPAPAPAAAPPAPAAPRERRCHRCRVAVAGQVARFPKSRRKASLCSSDSLASLTLNSPPPTSAEDEEGRSDGREGATAENDRCPGWSHRPIGKELSSSFSERRPRQTPGHASSRCKLAILIVWLSRRGGGAGGYRRSEHNRVRGATTFTSQLLFHHITCM